MALRCSEAGGVDAAVRLMAQHPAEQRHGGMCELPMDETGCCSFVDENLCGYRVRYGTSTLPASCIKFPYAGMTTPARSLLGLSFACPTALQMLLDEPQLEIAEDQTAPPPAGVMTDFRGTDSAELAAQAEQFWAIHWEWLTFARASGGPPEQWLRAIGEQASGLSLPTVKLDSCPWSGARWNRQAALLLIAEGAAEQVLAAVYDDPGAPLPAPDVQERGGSDEVLNRYLIHRLLVPEFLVASASLGRLLGVLFALMARYRFERALGRSPGHAIANLDRLILHSDYPRRLFPDDVEETVAWPSLALLALAQLPDDEAPDRG